MIYGMVKACAITPVIKAGDPAYNANEIISHIKKARKAGVEIAVFPELCVSGYTAADLFYTADLIDGTVEALKKIAKATPSDMLVFVGAPIAHEGRLYNCGVAMSDGGILGAVPKTELPDYGEFYEKRYFTPKPDRIVNIEALDNTLMGDILFVCGNEPRLVVACEICEDMWSDLPPSVEAARQGATVVVNLSASDEVVGKAEYRRMLVSSNSGRNKCAYVYADAGAGESSTDVVFSGHNIIAENGSIIAESAPFGGGLAVTDIDVERIDCERRRTGLRKPLRAPYVRVGFALGGSEKPFKIMRKIDKFPFVPDEPQKADRAELILSMQARGLKTRFDSSRAKTAVIGVSGGLDSALALLVCNRALGADKICAVTMPAFGTSDGTLENATRLCAALGVKLETIDIKNTVISHLKDIKHDKKDVTFENAQARTRTMTLFDIANKTGGLVVGTGDLSELALGWATYNGDHMSSYGVNAGVPKTLVKYLVAYEAERLGKNSKAAQMALEAILNTDISPELLPPEDGKIAQKTEDILGKYDLLDFVIYYYVRYGFSRDKIEFLLRAAWGGAGEEQIQKALDTFYKRFFAAQFKRSCLPDGVKIGSVSFSPRSDFRLPSDIGS